MASTLRIRLLGAVDLRLDGAPVPPLESARAESLLAYLLIHREAPQPRQQLAFLLWPDSTESQARTNLRHVLHILRRALPDPDQFLAVTPRTLQWRADAPFWLDVVAFNEAISRAERDSPDSLAALRDAVALYEGDLLQGCDDEWIEGARDDLRQHFLEALARLAALLEARREYVEAIVHAERLLRLDPLDEETFRLLMRLHDARGNRARALRVYHDCVATLERELGVEPSAATHDAYEALLPVERAPAADKRQGRRIGGPPLVGRGSEWTRLTTIWREAEGGRAQLVLVSGEAGVGKTRLVEELRSWCAHRGGVTAEARSYFAEGALAYGPLVEWLRSEPLKGRLVRLDPATLAELARLLPELRSPAPDSGLQESLSESERRRRLFDALARALLAVGAPLLLIAEDLQWCEPQTLQFLHYLLRSNQNSPLLVAATARREEADAAHPLNDLLAGLRLLDRVTEIPIGRLSREETAVLAERVAEHQLAAPAADQLYAETEGNPLFVIEALRAGWSGEHAVRPWLTAKVQAVIESRLAQLSAPARDLIGVAATVGREFTPDVLTHAADVDEDTLMRGLDELWRRRIIREQGAHAYDFSHDKIREVAYLGLSPAHRRRLHASVAHGLERLHAEDPGTVTGQIAAHWERAGQLDRAMDWYLRAADAAQTLYANVEAIRLLDHALGLLRTQPETAARAEREMAILAAQPAMLGWVEGYASPRLAAVHRRALDLASTRGVALPSQLLRSLAVSSLTQGDFAAAREFGAQLRQRGDREMDDVLLVEREYVLGIAAFWQGELEAARGHFETAVDRYRPAFRRAHILQYGLDPKVICLSRLGNTLWFLGQPAAAARARDAALALADEVRHPFTRSTALVFGALLALEMHDLDGVRVHAEALLADRGDDLTKPTQVSAEAFAGFLEVVDGRVAPGIARLRHAIEESSKAEHAPGLHASNLRVLLAALAASGNVAASLEASERAIDLAAVHLWEAEARRYRAECLAAVDAPREEVEAEFARAIEVARRQGARVLELRAASSLLRLRRHFDNAPAIREAHEMLQALLDTMPAAHGTPEAHEARSLLG